MQKSRADPRVQEIGDQCTEAYIGEKMVGHMNAVVAVKQYENAGKGKSDAVSLCAAVFQKPRQMSGYDNTRVTKRFPGKRHSKNSVLPSK